MASRKVILRTDLPDFYQKAGDSAAKSQKLFLSWNLINILVLTIAAAVSALKNWLHPIGTITAAALIGSGAFITFWLRRSRHERQWYSSRAVAESAKTLSWRYMMCASPFVGGSPREEAKAAILFEKLLHDIADQEAAPVPKTHEITAKMKEIRLRTTTERANLYLTERIEDQRIWYADNSEKNDVIGKQVLGFAITTQAIACLIALAQILKETPDFVGVFATVSASALAWMQLKKYEDLAQAYVTAAKELSRIGSTINPTIVSDVELSRFVLDAENAISREHTLWIAKRASPVASA